MRRVDRTSPLTVLAFAAAGVATGLLVQFFLSSRGRPPLVPPIPLPVTILILAVGILALGLVLRRATTRDTGGNVNPFTAVRILAAARAGQFAGALLGGFGGGLALSLLTRSVPAPTETWLPMLLVLASGVALVVCGVIAEHLCRIPPDDEERDADAADQPA
ncbi:DUF3180 domain-containing protein [Leucobacter sp. CSA1]|uniref:DUF3180 domain-containing protein n=1 Tax=Leucobacter chromiisoli TaxID=2796471 RepID=A0A934UTW8_9MICO|nr:DUF3180 family protein [Leucobacter chromiisoli]MBK0417786.1 DUF3180 domain-containing protein [Leucobacter chromiisoli]